MLGIDPYLSSFEDITEQIQLLGEKERKRLYTICETCLNNKVLTRDTSTRIAVVKIILNFLPESEAVIRDIIRKKKDRYDYEMHFSLFCYLDDVSSLSVGRNFSREIPLIIEEYLMEIDTDTASAAFMAGDLLGDHWNVAEAFQVLKKVVKEARYSIGRDNAVHGLGYLLDRLSDPEDISSIISLLIETSEKDRSSSVRLAARMVLNQYKDKSLF